MCGPAQAGISGSAAMILVVLTFLLHATGASAIECVRRVCNLETPKALVCHQSMILISDVTDWRAKRNHAALAHMKSVCMGRESCDPSAVCSKSSEGGTLFIQYSCQDAKNVFTSTCDGTVFDIPAQHGFIQSPNYPASLPDRKSCHWRIATPNDSLVFLTLHDIITSRPTDNRCHGGLTISGLDCETQSGVSQVHLCGWKNDTSMFGCGLIAIALSGSNKIYPLRFWLEFRVVPKTQQSDTVTSYLNCSGRVRSTATGTAPTPNSAMTTTETDTQLLIILLSVISSLSGALIIILVIVCIRCHLMRMTASDHVYCEPSPALQAHYDYISSLDTDKDKPPPKLADEYFEVADALPYSLRTTPASPAYVDMDQFIDFKRGPQSSADSVEWADCQSQNSSAAAAEEASEHEQQLMGESPGTPRKWKKKLSFTERKARSFFIPSKLSSSKNSGSPVVHKNNGGKNSSSPSSASKPKVFVVNLDKNVPEPETETSLCELDDASAYEQVEVLPEGDERRVVLGNSNSCLVSRGWEPEQSNLRRPPTTTSLGTKGKSSSSHKSRVDQIKEGLLSKHNDGPKDGIIYSKAKEMGLQKMPSSSHSPRKSRNSRPSTSTPDKKQKCSGEGTGGRKVTESQSCGDEDARNSQKPLLLKERLQTSGIVRNGIQKFESSSGE